MCGRFTQYNRSRLLARLFRLECQFDADEPRYNLAPTQSVLAVREGQRGREAVFLRWGLIPSWAKDPSFASQTINARIETVADKPAYRSAFRARRCLIPAEGFYEWKAGAGRRKTPYFIHRRDGEPLIFAGLWESWTPTEGEAVETCTILTTAANELLRPLYERMPVILDGARAEEWLDTRNADEAFQKRIAASAPAEELALYPVGHAVSGVKREGPGLIAPAEPVAEPASLFPDD